MMIFQHTVLIQRTSKVAPSKLIIKTFNYYITKVKAEVKVKDETKVKVHSI